MLGILADHHDFAFALDDLAFFADLLYGWFYFHRVNPPVSSNAVNRVFYHKVKE